MHGYSYILCYEIDVASLNAIFCQSTAIPFNSTTIFSPCYVQSESCK